MNSLFLLGSEVSIQDAPMTYLLLGIIVFTSYRFMEPSSEKERMMFVPYVMERNKEWYRFFSHGFVHGDWIHLLLNSYVLLIFGGSLEYTLKHPDLFGNLGTLVYLGLFVSGLLMSSVYSFFKHRYNGYYRALGASGAVSSVVFASILINPLAGLGLIFIPIRFPAFIFGTLYLIYSAYKSKQGNDNIGHDAHYWGSVWGFAFLAILKPSLVEAFLLQIRYYIMYQLGML